MTDAEALRAALLDLLIQMPGQLLATAEGREQIAGEYRLAAESAHPAVAEVFREAAGILERPLSEWG